LEGARRRQLPAAHEAIKLETADPQLWRHLGNDPDRVLSLALEYMRLGLYDDAVELLERPFPVAEAPETEPGSVSPQGHPLVAYYRGYCRQRSGGSGLADFEAASALSPRYVFPSRAETVAVLEAALASNPGDVTARFLLGSAHLASGRVDDAVGAWQKVRRLDPGCAVLHRNLGLTLLQGRHEPKAAYDVFLEGIEGDPTNADLYRGAGRASSLVGLDAADRVALLERYPDRSTMPPDLLQALALALTEAGRSQEAEGLFEGRFFPRAEWGTNVRQVYIEVRVRRALDLARRGRCDEVPALVDSLAAPRPGLSFTQSGLEPFVEAAHVRFLLGEATAACGSQEAARSHWERAEHGREPFSLQPVYGYLAARRLGRADEAAWRQRLESALESAELQLDLGTSFLSQGLLLRALGREDEAQERLRSVFLVGDQRLSHFLTRRALEQHEPL
jgi:tetratricopeptide (TPR) repeat protein